MKKSIIIFAVACAVYGSTLLAIGIYIMKYNLSELFVLLLAEKLNIIGAVLALVLFLPIILMRIIPYVFIIYGAGYILFFPRTLYNLRKDNFPWCYKNLLILFISHCCFAILLLLADIVIIAYMFNTARDGVSAALIIFTVLINVTAIALGTANFFALKKFKQNKST